MKFFVSTSPQAGDKEAEECATCGALIAPGAYLKHRDSHGDLTAQIAEEFDENETFSELRETVDSLGATLAELKAAFEALKSEFEIHEQGHSA
jgi:hypothetical protein